MIKLIIPMVGDQLSLDWPTPAALADLSITKSCEGLTDFSTKYRFWGWLLLTYYLFF